MKKIILGICLLVSTITVFSQSDSNFHKVSVRLSGEFAFSLSSAYGSYYGLGNLGIDYHISPKYSVEVWFAYDSLPMIDQKDFIKSNFPSDYNIFYSYSGGSLKFTTIGAAFKYDFYRHTGIQLYGLAGPSIYVISEKAITGSDVLLRSKAPVYTYAPDASETVLGFRLAAGGAYYLGKHFDLFLEADYQLILTNKTSASSLSQVPVYLGIEYGF